MHYIEVSRDKKNTPLEKKKLEAKILDEKLCPSFD